MRYDYLSKDDRERIKDERRLEIAAELRRIEEEYFRRELDYRIASKKAPPDDAAMTAARATQASLDAEYATVEAVLEAAKGQV